MNLFRTKSIEQSMSDADEPGRKLKRSLSSWDLMIMGVAVAVQPYLVRGVAYRPIEPAFYGRRRGGNTPSQLLVACGVGNLGKLLVEVQRCQQAQVLQQALL